MELREKIESLLKRYQEDYNEMCANVKNVEDDYTQDLAGGVINAYADFIIDLKEVLEVD